MVQTYGNGFDRLSPDDWSCTILAGAVTAHVGLGKGCVRAAEALLLCLAKLAAGFYHEDALDAVSHGWEALDSLKKASVLVYMYAYMCVEESALTRSMSSMRVPRPGPTSMSWTPLLGRPWLIHSAMNQIPRSSPKIWEISGEVTKSPLAPNWSRSWPTAPV